MKEYKTIFFESMRALKNRIQETLNNMVSEGWELHSVCSVRDLSICIFERD